VTEAKSPRERTRHSNGKGGEPLPERCLDQIFYEARTHNKWLDRDISDATLHELVNLLKLGPTSANCSPARFLFVKSREAKLRLRPHLSEGNREKTMAAPVCTVIGYDLDFYEHLPKLFSHANAKSWFEGDEKKIFETAFRNGTLQGAYLIIAARALGLDCGPMSGFDKASTAISSPAPKSSRTSCAAWGLAMPAFYSPARRASASTRWRASSRAE